MSTFFSETHFRHTAPITSLSVTKDGTHLLAVGGSRASIFSATTGKLLKQTSLEDHGDIQDAVFSPDGTSIFACTLTPKGQIFEIPLETFKTQNPHSFASYSMRCLVLSPDGGAFVSYAKKLFALYRTKDGEQICELEKSYNSRTNNPERAVFSPDGKLLMTAPRGRYITNQQKKSKWPFHFWSTRTGKIVKTFKGTGFALCDVAFTPRGAPVTIDRNGAVCLYDKTSGDIVWTFYTGSWAYQDPNEEHRLVVSPDGKWIAVSIDDRLIYLLNAKTGEPLWKVRRAYIHKISAIVFSPDNEQLFVSDGARVRVFSVADGAERTPPGGCLGPISRIIEVEHNEAVVVGEKDPYLWRVSSQDAKQVLREDEAPSIARSPFDSASFTLISGDGSTVAMLDTDAGGDVFSAKTGAFICRVPLAANDRIHSAALSFDGRILALTMTRGSNLYPHSEKDVARLALFSIEAGCFTAHLAEGKLLGALKSPMFSPDGRFIACVNKTQVLLFDCQSMRLLSTLYANLSTFSSGCFSKDSRSFFGLDESRLLVGWSLPEAKVIYRGLTPHKYYTHVLCDVHDGIAAIKTQQASYLLHMKDNTVETLKAESAITAISFSRLTPGRILLGHADGTITTNTPREAQPATSKSIGKKSTNKKIQGNTKAKNPTNKEAMQWLSSFEALLRPASRGDTLHRGSQEGSSLAPERRNIDSDPSEGGASLAPDLSAGLMEMIASMPQSAAEDDSVLSRVRSLLLDDAMQSGVTDVHRAMSQRLLSLRPWRWHNDQRVPSHIETVSLHPSGHFLAIGSNCGYDNNPGGTIQLYDMATGHCVQTIYNILWGLGQGRGSGDQERMRWSPNGKLLGSSFNQDGVAVFDPFAERNHMRAIPHYTGNVDSGPAWCFVGDQEVAVGFEVNEGWPRAKYSFLPLSLYNIEESPYAYRPLAPNKPIKGFDKENPIDWNHWMGASPDGRRLCVSAREPAMVIDTRTKEIVCKLEGSGGYHSKGALFSPDTNWLYDGALYSTRDGKQVPLGAGSFDSRWSPSSEWLAIAGKDGVCLYSTKQKKIVAMIPCDTPKDPYDVLLGDSGALAFSPDSQYLAIKEEAQVSVWSVSKEPEEKARIALDDDREVSGLALGANAETLALWGREFVEFWHVSSMKRLKLVRWTDHVNRYYQDEAGHPLACAGGNAANVLPTDPSFPVPGLGWITAFSTGLIICPEPLKETLCDRLSLIIGDWFSWPLAWSIENFSLVGSLQDALSSEKFPKKIAPQIERWQSQKGHATNTGLQPSEHYGVRPSYTLGWYEPEAEYVIRDATHAREVLLSLKGRLIRIEQETDWSPDKAKVGVPYEFNNPDYAMLGLSMGDGGSGSGVHYKQIRKVYALRFSGHPEEAVLRVETPPLLSLSQKRVALLHITWAKEEVTRILTNANAVIVSEGDSPDLFVVYDPYEEEAKKALLAKGRDTLWVSYHSLCELVRLDAERAK